MSHYAQLLHQCCPEGVKWESVDDAVIGVPTGRGVQRQNYSRGTKIPIVDQGQSLIAGYTDDSSIAVPLGEYVVFGDHTRAVKWIDFTFAPGADGTKVLKPRPGILPRYLFFALSALQIPNRGYNRHWTILRRMRIPVPPLEVQDYIVRCLVNFDLLDGELVGEATLRDQQFAHYRDDFFSAAALVHPNTCLGEAGGFTRGKRFTKNDVTTSSDGIPAIHYGEIYTHYGSAATDVMSHVRAGLSSKLRFVEPGSVIIAGVGETVDEVAKAVAWLGATPVAIHDDTFSFRSDLDPRYVSYFFQSSSFHNQKNQHVTRTKVKRISSRGLSKVLIPVPPLKEQQRIASSLSTFEELMVEAIPGERVARRTQYEYYRERLLDFEELGA